MPDLYEVLQVDPKADPDVIRAAYRVLARKYHPDHGGDPRQMTALNDAMDVLGDPQRRAEYDVTRNAAAARQGFSSASTFGEGPFSGNAPAGSSGSARTNDVQRAGPPPGRPSGTVLDFGRYAGWSLGEIARYDRDYLEWLLRATVARNLRGEIEAILRGAGSVVHHSAGGLPRR